jgi:hypothetical protein
MSQPPPAPAPRRHWARPRPLRCASLGIVLVLVLGSAANAPAMLAIDPLTGPRTPLNKDWIGRRSLAAGAPILVMAGHADSQGMAGSGTSGEAVDRFGAQPMVPGIRDELYWNLLTAERVVALGRQRGLPISLYVPEQRSIADGDDPRTNWSVGKEHVRRGGYAMEIHFDAYGPDGFGSGLIPPLHQAPSLLDESLAAAFGAFPHQFRGGLGAPRRGIAILEIGKLESPLESALRDPSSRDAALNAIAERVVLALEQGISPRSTALPATSWTNPAPRP